MIRNNARKNHHETRCSKLFKIFEAGSAYNQPISSLWPLTSSVLAACAQPEVSKTKSICLITPRQAAESLKNEPSCKKKKKNKLRWTATTLLWNNGRFVCQRVFGTTAWWNMSRQHVSATAWKWRRRLQFSQSDETANESHRKHSTASRTHNQQLVFFCLQLLFKSQINLKIKSDCF